MDIVSLTLTEVWTRDLHGKFFAGIPRVREQNLRQSRGMGIYLAKIPR